MVWGIVDADRIVNDARFSGVWPSVRAVSRRRPVRRTRAVKSGQVLREDDKSVSVLP
jgi:hypothetical protein